MLWTVHNRIMINCDTKDNFQIIKLSESNSFYDIQTIGYG